MSINEDKSDKRDLAWYGPITRRIFFANMSGLVVLILATLILNEIRTGYVKTKTNDLVLQAEIFANLIEEQATIGEPRPTMQMTLITDLIEKLNLPAPLRLIMSDENGVRIADSFLLSDRVNLSELPPVQPRTELGMAWRRFRTRLSALVGVVLPRNYNQAIENRSLKDEIMAANYGEYQASQRVSERGQRVLSATVPVRRVSQTIGYLTLESSDIESIIRTERYALIPFTILAIFLSVATSVSLSRNIGQPLYRLSRAIRQIELGKSETLNLPDLVKRKDEIGELTQSLDGMTEALMERISANAAFAADVAHELKNPLTAIRSAIETAEMVKDDPSKMSTLRALIAQEVNRLNRLITDISNASRLEAELSNTPQENVELVAFLRSLVDRYQMQTNMSGGVPVTFKNMTGQARVLTQARVGALEQVVLNLVDNALSFSDADGGVNICLEEGISGEKQTVTISVEDEGPGIPSDKLSKIFDRFYTDRPEGSRGSNSGLGLSIVQQIVDFHNGKIEAMNRSGGGARFVVTLRRV